ncbi:MAG: hypothetical protein HDR32_10050 [Treponema sp.]|nr:hypothetical protein [Treponema sp.]
MKITKELLEHLKVMSISLKDNGADILCFLERIEKGLWTFSLPQKIDFRKDSKAAFQISFDRDASPAVLPITVVDSGEDWANVIPTARNVEPRLSAFLKAITGMEEKYESFGRRKEERIRIGKEKAAEFGLSALEQSIFLQGVKCIQPCVVLDASIHGICVITPETPAVRNEENFCIRLGFKKPEQTIILKAHRVYSRLNKTGQKTFMTLSCQLLEPVHFAWKERVIAMLEKQP